MCKVTTFHQRIRDKLSNTNAKIRIAVCVCVCVEVLLIISIIETDCLFFAAVLLCHYPSSLRLTL